MIRLDALDRRVLALLRANARMSNAAIARDVGLAPSAIFQRIRKLEQSGIVKGYATRISPRALGYAITAFIMVQARSDSAEEETAGQLAALDAVQEVHRVVGEDCFIAKVHARDTDELSELLEHGIQSIPSVAATRTTIVVRTLKEAADPPFEAANMSSDAITSIEPFT